MMTSGGNIISGERRGDRSNRCEKDNKREKEEYEYLVERLGRREV